MNHKGETIVESLISVLIIVICFVALQSSIIASARVNNKAKQINQPFQNNGKLDSSLHVTIERNGSKTNTNIGVYKEEDTGYYYYE